MFPGMLSRRAAGIAVSLAVPLLFVLAGTRTAPVVASRLAATWGGGQTAVWVQNLDPQNAALVIARFYTVPGDPPQPPVVVLSDATFPLGASPSSTPRWPKAFQVPPATLDKYALIIESDRHVAAINVTDEPFNGSAVAYNDAPCLQTWWCPWR